MSNTPLEPLKSRTIDNLGIDASRRYAENQQLYDAKLIEEASSVSQRSSVSVIAPYRPSEFDQFFSLPKTLRWASFEPPPNYTISDKLFTHQAIPSLGEPDVQDAHLQKLLALQKQKRKKNQKPEDLKEQEHDLADQKKGNAAQIAKLIDFFEHLQRIDKTLITINGKRQQYQKG